MNKKIAAVITAIIVLISALCVGTAIYFKNKKVVADGSYSTVELSADKINFSEKSNKPNIELVLDRKTFAEAFGEEVKSFSYKKADRIRIHFSDGKKYEIEPSEETVKIKRDDGTVSIKVYIEDKNVFETANKLIRFDTACSVKVFFDAGTFAVDDGVSDAVTFILKSESKPVSNVQQAYLRATYENYVLKLKMTDTKGDEICFTVSGNANDDITVITDRTNKFTFGSSIVTTEMFRTAILNPSEDIADAETIGIYVPDGFFVDSEGNRIQVLGLKNSGTTFRLLEAENVVTTTAKPLQGDATQAINLTATDGVTASVNYEIEFPNRYGEIIRNGIYTEVVIPTDEDWNDCVFTGKLITSTEIYDITSDMIDFLESEVVRGYVATVLIRDLETREINGVQIDGILFEEGTVYDMELTVTDEEGNIVANISVPLEI